MTNGATVRWTSHKNKERQGRYICDSLVRPQYAMVVGAWDNRMHIMRKSKLFTVKGGAGDRHPLHPANADQRRNAN